MNWNLLFQSQYYQVNDQIGTKNLGYLTKNTDSKDVE